MRVLGIAFLSIFMVHSASAMFAFDRRAANGMNTYNNGYGGGNGGAFTGEGVGAGFLSCGCAEQILQKRTNTGDACDNYARLHVNAITNPSVGAGVAPASPQAGHQLLQ